mmetsp:Transcript_110565/g.311846  ORF Transcript_110565/g.311846 Transcript_110565/m.311846 type:complete len:120 (-) Transcript_110565:1701-2060(-)
MGCSSHRQALQMLQRQRPRHGEHDTDGATADAEMRVESIPQPMKIWDKYKGVPDIRQAQHTPRIMAAHAHGNPRGPPEVSEEAASTSSYHCFVIRLFDSTTQELLINFAGGSMAWKLFR